MPPPPVAIRAWCDERVRIGKNTYNDPQIAEAMACADEMERQQVLSKLAKRSAGDHSPND